MGELKLLHKVGEVVLVIIHQQFIIHFNLQHSIRVILIALIDIDIVIIRIINVTIILTISQGALLGRSRCGFVFSTLLCIVTRHETIKGLINEVDLFQNHFIHCMGRGEFCGEEVGTGTCCCGCCRCIATATTTSCCHRCEFCFLVILLCCGCRHRITLTTHQDETATWRKSGAEEEIGDLHATILADLGECCVHHAEVVKIYQQLGQVAQWDAPGVCFEEEEIAVGCWAVDVKEGGPGGGEECGGGACCRV